MKRKNNFCVFWRFLTKQKLQNKKKRKNKFLPSWIYLITVWGFGAACLNIILFSTLNTALPRAYLNYNHKPIQSQEHLKKPQQVRGIYITAYTAGTDRFDELIKFAKKNNFNAVVLDIKGPNGEPAFTLKRESLKKYNSKKSLYDINKIIEKLHKNGLYAIARLFVFQDPYLVKMEPQYALKTKAGGFWADYKGVKWLDPTHFGVWKYNTDFAREAYERGFDEINFDYIRFPSDGNLTFIEYSNWDKTTAKEIEVEKFFKYLSRIMRNTKIPISADLFGLVCCYNDYDLGIGQKLSRALPYFDYIAPMMYPSHYSDGFIGLKNPASHPYAVIKYSMQEANKIRDKMMASSTVKLAELRPWIQDFDLGANYDAYKVKEQIRAIEEEGGEGFLIWNARNMYTSIR